MKYLVTGAAGFIGSAVVEKLIQQGHFVVGIDNINDYYDVGLKHARIKRIANPNFKFIKLDIVESQALLDLFNAEQFDMVIHLAAQAGVRYSIENPSAYVDSNLVGYVNMLESCRHNNIKHFIYASSSSVYGLNNQVPFSTTDRVDNPISLYAATKKSNELMAHCYSHLYDLPTTGLRFFTVYGAWGRPDMAPFIFTKKILNGETIDINNNGDMWRDFTHINDIVEGVIRVANIVPNNKNNTDINKNSLTSDLSSSEHSLNNKAPYQIYNIGHGSPVNLMAFVQEIENQLGIKAKKNFRAMQPGDVYQTYADTQDLFLATDYKPKVSLEEGVHDLISWYKNYYQCR